MGMFCEYLPDFVQEISAGAAVQNYMWWLAIDCKMLTEGKEVKSVLDFFSLLH